MLRRNAIDVIQFEYGGCNLDSRVYLADIWDFFSERGYSIAKLAPNELRRIHAYDQSLETFRYSNYVAYRPDSLLLAEL